MRAGAWEGAWEGLMVKGGRLQIVRCAPQETRPAMTADGLRRSGAFCMTGQGADIWLSVLDLKLSEAVRY